MSKAEDKELQVQYRQVLERNRIAGEISARYRTGTIQLVAHTAHWPERHRRVAAQSRHRRSPGAAPGRSFMLGREGDARGIVFGKLCVQGSIPRVLAFLELVRTAQREDGGCGSEASSPTADAGPERSQRLADLSS